MQIHSGRCGLTLAALTQVTPAGTSGAKLTPSCTLHVHGSRCRSRQMVLETVARLRYLPSDVLCRLATCRWTVVAAFLEPTHHVSLLQIALFNTTTRASSADDNTNTHPRNASLESPSNTGLLVPRSINPRDHGDKQLETNLPGSRHYSVLDPTFR